MTTEFPQLTASKTSTAINRESRQRAIMNTLEHPPTANRTISSEISPLLAPSPIPSDLFADLGRELRELFQSDELAIWSTESEVHDAVLRTYACRAGLELAPFTELAGLDEAVQFVASVRGTSPMLWSEQSKAAVDASCAIDGAADEDILLCSIQTSDRRSYGVLAVRPAPPAESVLRESFSTIIENLAHALRGDRQMDRMRRAERAHDALIYGAPIVVCCLDSQCNLTLWNPAAEQLFGWRAPEVLGRRLPFVPQAEREVVDLCCRGALAGDATQKIEMQCVTRSGSELFVALSAVPLYEQSRSVNRILIVATDITDRKLAETRDRLQMRVAETFSRAHSLDESLESILTYLCEVNHWEAGEYWTFDASMRRLIWRAGSRPRSAIADQYLTAIRGGGDQQVDDLPGRVADTPEPVWLPAFSADRSSDRALLAARCGLNDAIGFRVVHANTTLGVIVFTADRIDRPDPRLLRCLQSIGEQVGSFVQQQAMISRLRLAEEKQLQFKKLDTITSLVGGFVHDFNNLMTVILGYGDLLRGEDVDHEFSREAALEMFEAAKQASLLTRRLLAISRKTNVEPVSVDLNSVVEQLQPMIQRTLGKGVDIRCDLAPRLGPFAAPQGQIEQLIMNLTTNARDAMESSGHFTITTREVELDPSRRREFPNLTPGPYVSLTVEDTGCGMNDAVKERMFDPFFTTKPAEKGTGIGLATVREIVDGCGGHIRVQSQPGEGTKFEILFPPLKDGLRCWVVESPPRRLANGTESVFVVDDDAAVCRLARMVLSAQGYSVVACDNVKTAASTLARHRGKVDLLVIDLMSAGSHGLDLVRRVSSANRQLRVLCVGDQGNETEKWPVLEKPFTSHELSAKVREILDAT